MNILKKLKILLDNPIIDTIANIYKKFKSSKSYWSVSSLILIFTLREAIAIQWGDIIQNGIETYSKDSSYPYFWEGLKFLFEGGSIEFLFMGIGIFLILSLVKWNESKKEQVVYHDSVVIEHNNRSYLTFLLIPLVLLGIIFTFEKPREYVKSLYAEYHKNKPHKKTFSLTDNLSAYHLMPNPTYEEWKFFLKEEDNSKAQNNYEEFIEVKNSIDSFNLLKDYVIYNNDAEKKLQENNNTFYIEPISTLNSPVLIDNLTTLLELNKSTPNTLIAYYIDILKLHFKIDNFFAFDTVIDEFKSKGYKVYAEDLNYIASAIQDRNISKINKNNELLSSCYYTYFHTYDKIDISILKEDLPYSYCSFDILLCNSTLSTEKKLESIESFLTKNDKEHNGNVLINAYLNLLIELPSKRKLFYKLLKNYQIDEDSKISLSLLLATNKEVKKDEFIDILIIFYPLKREKSLRDKYLEVKTNKKSIEGLFEILNAEKNFSFLPVRLSSIAKVLKSDKICNNHKNILHTAFGLYINNIDYLEDKTSVFLDKNLTDKFYLIHNINNDDCLKKYATLPREINSEKYKVITADFIKKFPLKFGNSLVKSNTDKLIDLIYNDINITDYHLDSDSYHFQYNQSWGEDNQSFGIPKEYIPIIKLFLNGLNEKKELPQIATVLLDTVNKFYIKYEEEIITHKLSNNTARNKFIEMFKIKLNNLKNPQHDTCYTLLTLEKIAEYFDKWQSLTDFMKDIDLKKCSKYKQKFIIDKDFLLYLALHKIDISKAILKDYSDLNISISTPTNILENKISENSFYKLLNLLSSSFYKKYNIHELKDIIELYQEKYDKDLVNNLLIYSILVFNKNQISLEKMTKLISIIDFKLGKHTYLIPLKNKNKLGKIVKLSYIPSYYNNKNNQKLIFGINYESPLGLEIQGFLGLHQVQIGSGFHTSVPLDNTLLLSSYISGDIKELLLKKAIESSDKLYKKGHLPNYFIDNLSPKYSKLDIANELYLLANKNSKEHNITKNKKAINEYEEALKIYKISNMEKNSLYIKEGNIYNHLGVIYNKYFNKPNKAIDKYKQSINSFKKLNNKNIDKFLWIGLNYNNLAKIYENQNFLQEAVFNYQESLNSYKGFKSKYPKKFEEKKAYIYLYLGSLYLLKKKEYKNAIKACNISLNMYKSINDNELIAGNYYNLAKAYENLEQYTNSINSYKEAIIFYKKLKNTSSKVKFITTTYKNLGQLYLKLKMNQKAIKEYYKLIKLYQKVKKQNPKYYNKQIAHELFNLGNIYFGIKQYKNARKVYKKSLIYIKGKEKKFNFSKFATIANLHRNIAHTYKLLGEYRKAIDEYKKALTLYEKLNGIKKGSFKKYIFNTKGNLNFLYGKIGKYVK